MEQVRNSKEKIIAVKDLSVTLGEVEVLKDISFEISKGSFTGIIGPNGAGKSTLIKAILGFIDYGGMVVLDGTVGYVPQLSSFNREFPMNVYDFVRLPIRKEKNWKERVDSILTEVGLEGFGPKLVGKLSGGEFQRAALARALISKPDILILDEPEAGVDQMGKARFYDLLNSLKQEENITILMVSHDIGLIFEKCDNVMCLNKTLHCHGPTESMSIEDVKKTFGEFDIWIRSDGHYEVEHEHHEHQTHSEVRNGRKQRDNNGHNK